MSFHVPSNLWQCKCVKISVKVADSGANQVSYFKPSCSIHLFYCPQISYILLLTHSVVIWKIGVHLDSIEIRALHLLWITISGTFFQFMTPYKSTCLHLSKWNTSTRLLLLCYCWYYGQLDTQILGSICRKVDSCKRRDTTNLVFHLMLLRDKAVAGWFFRYEHFVISLYFFHPRFSSFWEIITAKILYNFSGCLQVIAPFKSYNPQFIISQYHDRVLEHT